MRPLTVCTVWSSRPLLSRRRPVSASRGGKSRFRGIDSQLQGGLEDFAAGAAAGGADGLLAVGDKVAGRGPADCVGGLPADLLAVGLSGAGQGLGGGGGERGQ